MSRLPQLFRQCMLLWSLRLQNLFAAYLATVYLQLSETIGAHQDVVRNGNQGQVSVLAHGCVKASARQRGQLEAVVCCSYYPRESCSGSTREQRFTEVDALMLLAMPALVSVDGACFRLVGNTVCILGSVQETACSHPLPSICKVLCRRRSCSALQLPLFAAYVRPGEIREAPVLQKPSDRLAGPWPPTVSFGTQSN